MSGIAIRSISGIYKSVLVGLPEKISRSNLVLPTTTQQPQEINPLYFLPFYAPPPKATVATALSSAAAAPNHRCSAALFFPIDSIE
ncbi:hypothetical protein L6452_33608 [Arctium lappa]|uniref:Uncharacterized protein n=1 Tax=Arctium lappa TaxID=4217 RepID=A0ACB8YK35_ARCLA|nr:hypothetical protein L6452_33608 [Arctium lappa]